jgi:hypothetical protein
MPSLSPDLTVGKSGKHRNSQSISILRVMICLALSGCVAQDDTVIPPADWVDFVFPLAAGTTWNYTHSYSAGRSGAQRVEQLGHQVWRSAGTWTANSVKILVTSIDTTRTWVTMIGPVDTAIQITRVDTSFSIIVTPDSLDIQWYQIKGFHSHSFIWGLFRIPRMVKQNTNTLTNQWEHAEYYMSATYAIGKGLTSWEEYSGYNFYWNERLTLESVSP